MTKLEKIGEELEKARARHTHWGSRVKELEEKYCEEENSVIHSMVHAANLTPKQLAQIIAAAARGNVGAYPEGTVQEENEEEEIYSE